MSDYLTGKDGTCRTDYCQARPTVILNSAYGKNYAYCQEHARMWLTDFSWKEVGRIESVPDTESAWDE